MTVYVVDAFFINIEDFHATISGEKCTKWFFIKTNDVI